MAAPTFSAAGTGKQNASGAGDLDLDPVSATVGQFVVLQILVDNSTDVSHSIMSSTSGVENLAGTDNTMTQIGTTFQVGGTNVGNQRLFVGRAISTTVTIWLTRGSGGSSTYYRVYLFDNVNTGTALSDVIENSSAGATTNTNGTSSTIADAAVTTLGVDRLACNFVGVNDDNPVGAFTGMTGGTWAEAVAEYADSTGTDGCIQLQTAAMASAGTIDGGSYTMSASDGWGVVGFALIGTTSAGTTYTKAGIGKENQ